jgi:hypothetical protein
MTDKITDALTARLAVDALDKQLRTSRYNPDLYKYHANLIEMVKHLSILEVEARQTRRDRKVQAYIAEIEQSIQYLRNLILVLKLMD